MEKRIKVAGAIVAAIAAAACAGVAPAGDSGGWRLASAVEHSFPYNYVAFADATRGVTAGYAGETHYTSDGGRTWSLAVNNTWCLFGLEYADDATLYSCGNAGHVAKSVDGGANWARVADFGGMEPNQCRFLSFADPATGWIAAPFAIAATEDGGASWHEIALPAESVRLLAIARIDASSGAALDTEGQLWKTADSGRTWSVAWKAAEGFIGDLYSVPSVALRFVNARDAVLVYQRMIGEDCFWRVSRSADGGLSWTEGSIHGDQPVGAPFVNRKGDTLTFSDILDGIEVYSDD